MWLAEVLNTDGSTRVVEVCRTRKELDFVSDYHLTVLEHELDSSVTFVELAVRMFGSTDTTCGSYTTTFYIMSWIDGECTLFDLEQGYNFSKISWKDSQGCKHEREGDSLADTLWFVGKQKELEVTNG